MRTRMFVIYNYGDENQNPVFGSAINLATRIRDFIYWKLDRCDYREDGFIFENTFGSIRFNPDPALFPDKINLIKEVKSSVGTGELAIVQVDTGAVEKFNVSDMNVLEKIVFRMFFPDASMSEDKLIFAQNVVKQFNLTEDAISKLVKKGIFSNKDVSGYSFKRIRKSGFEKSVIEALDKYVKNHKSDVKIKSGVAVISDANEVFPFVLTDYLVKKAIRLIIGKVRYEDHYTFFNQFQFTFDEDDDEDDEFHDSPLSDNFHLAILIALACLQEGIGNFSDDNCFSITGDEIENACKIAKKVIDGKYVFKFENRGGKRIIIKDRPDFSIYWGYGEEPSFSVLKEVDLIEKVPETGETPEE